MSLLGRAGMDARIAQIEAGRRKQAAAARDDISAQDIAHGLEGLSVGYSHALSLGDPETHRRFHEDNDKYPASECKEHEDEDVQHYADPAGGYQAEKGNKQRLAEFRERLAQLEYGHHELVHSLNPSHFVSSDDGDPSIMPAGQADVPEPLEMVDPVCPPDTEKAYRDAIPGPGDFPSRSVPDHFVTFTPPGYFPPGHPSPPQGEFVLDPANYRNRALINGGTVLEAVTPRVSGSFTDGARSEAVPEAVKAHMEARRHPGINLPGSPHGMHSPDPKSPPDPHHFDRADAGSARERPLPKYHFPGDPVPVTAGFTSKNPG